MDTTMVGSRKRLLSQRSRALILAGAIAAAACGGAGSTPGAKRGIDRETFIATYVDLRAATLRGDSFAVSDAQRVEILARHGVTEADLLAFAELHGENVPFMRSVWDEVESRLDAERVLPSDSGGTAAPPAPAREPGPR